MAVVEVVVERDLCLAWAGALVLPEDPGREPAAGAGRYGLGLAVEVRWSVVEVRPPVSPKYFGGLVGRWRWGRKVVPVVVAVVVGVSCCGIG